MESAPLHRLFSMRPAVLIWSSVVVLCLIAYLDYLVEDISLGVLYVIPMLMVSLVMNRTQILAVALFMSVLRMIFAERFTPADTTLRFLLGLFAYCATGFLMVELSRNRKLILKHNQEMAEEQKLRMEAESNLRTLAESSPAAILTLDEDSHILSANVAAADLMGVPPEQMSGLPVAMHLPVLADALKFSVERPSFRTAAQCQGTRANGEAFVAQTWFSTYRTPKGKRLAAIAVDISEEVRDREEQNLRQMLANNRIVAAAVSHEIRNVCAAVAVVHSRLRLMPDLSENEDFRALGGLVEALFRIASTELHAKAHPLQGSTDLAEVLQQLRVIIEPDWREAGGSVRWSVPPTMPPVVGESFGVLQTLMNLSRNSLRAVNGSPAPSLRVDVGAKPGAVTVSVTDSGPGVQDPKGLFELFHSGTGNTGLGLYVSRAILRSYGGDLRYEPQNGQCRFVVELATQSRVKGTEGT